MNPGLIKRWWARFRSGDWVGDSRLRHAVWFVVELIARLINQMNAFRVTQRAAGVAFFTAVAFIPFLMILVITAERLNLLSSASDLILDAIIDNYVPIEKEQIILRIDKWVANARASGAGVVGIVIALIASMNLFSGFYALINDLWHVPRRNATFHKLSRFLLLILIAPPLLAVSTSVSTFFSLGFVPSMPIFTGIASRIAPLLLTFVAAFLGLKFIPRRYVHTRYAVYGALTAAIVFEIAKYGFGLYVSNVIRGSWLPIYGAIFILPVFLLWNFVVAMVVAATSSVAFLIQHWNDDQPVIKRNVSELTIQEHDVLLDSDDLTL